MTSLRPLRKIFSRNPSLAKETPPTKTHSAIPTQPDQLWDRAYDDLRQDNSKLFKLYETILSRELEGSQADPTGNVIEQANPAKRRTQMYRVLDASLLKSKKRAEVEKNIGDTMKIILSVKEAIGSGLQAVPIAAIVWTGVCVAMQVVLNPLNETAANRSGIERVIHKMKWYSSLSKLLLEKTFEQSEVFMELRGQLTIQILNLYKALLKYIIKTTCKYDRNPALEFLRGVVKLDDWTGSLDEINKAEGDVKAAASDYGVRQSNSYLEILVNIQLDDAQGKIMQSLCVTDMSSEIQSLQKRKDDLLVDSYKWILDNDDYREFTDWHNSRRLLWIRGDAGKGKTMLLIGIIRELTTQLDTHFDKSHLSYFFCQGTDARLNTATSILRGLIWMLLRQERSLIRHLDVFKDHGTTLFESRTAFYNLKKILQSMIEDEVLERAYLIVDALDECKKEEPGRSQLLELISESSKTNSKLKWLVSSRNEPDIKYILEEDTTRSSLSLEINAQSVAGAVEVYIDYKMKGLAETYEVKYKARKDPGIHEQLLKVQDDVGKELRRKANGTFLWVALVFKQIGRCEANKVVKLVQEIPSELSDVYGQMMRQVDQLDDDDSEFCKNVILTMVNSYRPLHLSELVALADLPQLAVHEEIVSRCGLLTIRDDDDTVYFVHQSAKDYLTKDPKTGILSKIFPHGLAEGHRRIVLQSLATMSTTLRRNIYGLESPGCQIMEIQSPDPDPLSSIGYVCIYWIDHICHLYEIRGGLNDRVAIQDDGPIDIFMKKHFLHWLEALSLLRSMSTAVIKIKMLVDSLTKHSSTAVDFLDFIRDAHRFILYNRFSIENAPLQLYVSALVFCPTKSRIREAFQDEYPSWISLPPRVEETWSPCLQTLESHTKAILSVMFFSGGRRLASASRHGEVRIWDAETGELQRTLETLAEQDSTAASFSHDGRLVAFACEDSSVIRIWDTETEILHQVLEGHKSRVRSVAFSPDGQQLASGSNDETLQIWNTETGVLQQVLKCDGYMIGSVAFSPDGQRLGSGSDDSIVRIWNTKTGVLRQIFEGPSDFISCVAFSYDGLQLASYCLLGEICIWDVEMGKLQQVIEGVPPMFSSVTFSHDGKRLACAGDNIVRIFDTETGVLQSSLEGHTNSVAVVAFSNDDQRVASGSYDKTVRIWDVGTRILGQTSKDHASHIHSMTISHDGRRLATCMVGNIVGIWDAHLGVLQHSLKGHTDWVRAVVFSCNDQYLASCSTDDTVHIWETEKGTLSQLLKGHTNMVISMKFSHNGKRIATCSYDKTIRIWNAETAELQRLLKLSGYWCNVLAFSRDDKRLASTGSENRVLIWDSETGDLQQSLQCPRVGTTSLVFSHDGEWLASSTDDGMIRIWDSETGVLQKILEIGTSLEVLSFSPDSSSITTDLGYITLDQVPSPPAQNANWSGFGVHFGKSWITWNGKRVLWLPPEYRPNTSIVREQTIAISRALDGLLLFQFNEDFPIL